VKQGGVYAPIGSEIEWVERPLVPDEKTLAKQILPGPDRLEVRLLPRAMADRLKLRSDEVGHAMRANDRAFGTIAEIYTDRLAELTSSRKWALGPDAHCTGGIMRPRWAERDLGEALRGPSSDLGRKTDHRWSTHVSARQLVRFCPISLRHVNTPQPAL